MLYCPFARIWWQELNVNVILHFNFFLKRLNSVSPKIDPEHCEAALLPENRKKNRSPEIYPCELFTRKPASIAQHNTVKNSQAKQSKAKQSKAKQSRTKHNTTQRNVKQHSAAQHREVHIVKLCIQLMHYESTLYSLSYLYGI